MSEVNEQTQVVCYEQQGKLILGKVVETKKNKLIVVNEYDKKLDLKINRAYALPKIENYSSLAELHNLALNLSKQIDISEIWETLLEENKEFTATEICNLIYADNSFLHHLSTYIAFIGDSIFFKRKEHSFKPRSEEIVLELKKKKEREEARINAVNDFVKFFKEKQVKLPSNCNFLKELLVKLVANSSSVSEQDKKLILLLVNELKSTKLISESKNLDKLALEILKKANLIDPFFNFGLVEFHVNDKHTDEEIALANELINRSLSETKREDLRELECITIDSKNTKDMDDALSLTKSDSGFELGIHITDVASYLENESKLDVLTRRRATSIYFFDDTINMFPDELSKNFFSLQENQDRKAISYLIKLNKDYSFISYRIVPSIINVKKKLSYDEVNKSLEANLSEYIRLYEIAMHFENVRLEAGGINILRKEIEIRKTDEGQIYLEEVFERSPARMLVSEMMIKANELTALYCKEHNLPNLFRGQPAPTEEPKLSGVPDGPAYEYAKRSTLKPSTTTLKPKPHATLGLTAYTQATSPIRRYTDIISQRQLLGHINNGKVYSKDELKTIQEELEAPLRKARQVSMQRKQFWLMCYLEQKKLKNENIKAVVLRNDMKKALVELDEVFMTTLISANGLKPGCEIELKIQFVNPFLKELKLAII